MHGVFFPIKGVKQFGHNPAAFLDAVLYADNRPKGRYAVGSLGNVFCSFSL